MKSAYGPHADRSDILPGLGVVAAALNQGDLARAMITALRLRLPDVGQEGAERLAKAAHILNKYDPNEPRDAHGRWTTGDGSDDASLIPAAGRKIVDPSADLCLDIERHCVVQALQDKSPRGRWSFTACQIAGEVCLDALTSSKLSPATEIIVKYPDNSVVSILDGEATVTWISGVKLPHAMGPK